MLRAIAPADREFYLAMADEFYRSEAVAHPVPGAYHERTFDEMMRSDAYLRGYIFEADGRRAGYAIAASGYSPEAGGKVLWLEEAYVLPEFRSRGLGREFFRHAESLEGYARLRLEVEPGNARARALYERLGYAPLEYVQMVKDKAD